MGEAATTAGEDASKAADKTVGAFESTTNQQNVKLRQLGRVFEDLSRGQGDAAVRMAERFASSFGIAGTAVIALGIAYETLKPVVQELWKKFGEGADSAKKATEENTKALDAYLDKIKHTTAEVEAYNKALESKIKLDAQADLKKTEAGALKEEAVPDAAAKDRAGRLSAAIGGKFPALTEAVQAQMQEQFEKENKATLEAIEALNKQMMPEELRTHRAQQLERQLTKKPGEIESDALRLVGFAKEGDAAAIAQLAEMMPGQIGVQQATEAAQQQRIIDEQTAAAAKEEKALAKKREAEAHTKAMTAAKFEEDRKADLQRRQAAQDKATEEALSYIAAWEAEKKMDEDKEKDAAMIRRHQADTARHQAEAARNKRDEVAALRESTALTMQVAQTDTPADIAPMVNRQAIQSSAKKALDLFHRGFRTGEQAAREAWEQEIERMRASLRHGPAQMTPSNNFIGQPF